MFIIIFDIIYDFAIKLYLKDYLLKNTIVDK